MTTLINKNATFEKLSAGKKLTVVTDAAGVAIVERYQGDVLLDTTSIAASTTKIFGEYRVDISLRITCLAGSLTYTQSQSTNSVKTGTATNDDANAGEVGEYLETTVLIGSLISETSATPVDVATLALTAGDWDVSGTINRALTGVTATAYGAAISPTANTVPGQAGGTGVGADSVVLENCTMGTTITGNFISRIGNVRVKLAAAATIHLVAADTFSAGSIGVYGTIRARRVR